MLSILIPTYNYNTLPLVKRIHTQLINANIPFEIICLDDASEQKRYTENTLINSFEFSKFEVLKQNIGRSKIRNKLANLASYEWLLFLDADILPKEDNFIKTYLDRNLDKNSVICGGVCYETKRPTKDKLLRWVYGRNREEISVKQRINNPYQHFLSANFLIRKKQFFKIRFNETLTTYGHEDTLFAIDLKQQQIPIQHIESPVYHLGIESNQIFLEKVKTAVKNADYLFQQKLITKNDINLITKYSSIKSLKMDKLMVMGFQKFRKRLERNLYSNKPSLFILDLYKLGYLCSLNSYPKLE